jgi:hypothetical protein
LRRLFSFEPPAHHRAARESAVKDVHLLFGIDEKKLKEMGPADEFLSGATEWRPIGEALPVRTSVRRSHQVRVM